MGKGVLSIKREVDSRMTIAAAPLPCSLHVKADGW